MIRLVLHVTLIYALAAAVGIGLITAAWSQDQERLIRQQFFKDSKQAKLVDGSEVNCCGPADAVRVKIIGASAGHLAAEIVDPMRHKYAKAGEVVTIPRGKIAKWPHSPQTLGTILFWSLSPEPSARRVYCLMPQAGG